MRRVERIADRSEEWAAEAARAKDWAAASNLHRSAIAASAQVAKLTGAAAPTQVNVKHSGSVNVDVELRLDAVLDVTAKILTPQEYTFLLDVLAKIAAAQDAGAFAEIAPPVDAELVDDADDKN